MTRPSPQTDRVTALIGMLAESSAPPLTLAEVTRRLGVNKSTCHSMLVALQATGWLVRDPASRAYRLGPALVAVGHRAAEGFPAIDLARSTMHEFAHRYGAHCVAFSIAGDRATVVDQVRDPRAASSDLRTGEIVLRPPLGSLVYAWVEPAAVDRWLGSELPEARRHYREVLEVTRRRRYSVELATPPETRMRNLVAQLREGLVREASAPPGPDAAVSGTTIGEMVDRLVDELGQVEQLEDVLPLVLEADHEYLVSSLSAPVFDHAGRVVLILSLLGIPGLLAGSDIERIGHQLAGATEAISAAPPAPTAPPAPAVGPPPTAGDWGTV